MLYRPEEFVSMIPHREGNRSQQKETIETRTTPTWLGHFFGYKEYTTQYYGYCTDWYILPDLWGCDTRKCLWLNRLWDRAKTQREFEPSFNDQFISELALYLDKQFAVTRLAARRSNNSRRLIIANLHTPPALAQTKGWVEVSFTDNDLGLLVVDRRCYHMRVLELADPNTTFETIAAAIQDRMPKEYFSD